MTDTATFDYGLQLRWADIDSLNHVNNVRYVDFALEATQQLIEDGALAGDLPVSRIEVDFLHPLMMTVRSVRIASIVDGGRVLHEIKGNGKVFCRVAMEFESLTMRFAAPRPGWTHLAQIRRADLDHSGHVGPAKLFELFQEARILYVTGLLESLSAGNFVVANLAVDRCRDIGRRREPWGITSWISQVGNSSLSITSHVADGDEVYATCEATLVGFDKSTQRSRRFTEEERDQLRAGL